MFKYCTNSWLFDKIHQILTEFNDYSLKQFTFNVINRLLIAIIFGLIDTSLKNNLQHVVSLVAKFFHGILQCQLEITQIRLVYAITVKIDCTLLITNCIYFNGSNLIINSNNVSYTRK